MAPPYPSAREIRKATRAAIAALRANDLDCYVFGSAACAIYGMENREPNVRLQKKKKLNQINCSFACPPIPIFLGRRHCSIDEEVPGIDSESHQVYR